VSVVSSPEFHETDAADFPERPHLWRSRQLSWDRTAATPTAEAAVADLTAELDARAARKRARKAADRRRVEATLGAIALDLFVAAGADPERWLAYSRRNEDYAAAKRRYLPVDVTPTAVREVADFLAGAGYAEAKRGSYRRRAFGGTGYRSRLRATNKLVAFFAGRGVRLDDVGVRKDAELIRLKAPALVRGGPKPLLGYDDTPDTERMRTLLLDWAAVAARHDIRPPDARAGGDRPEQDEGEGAGESIDFQHARLYRVFNNGSWKAGGRFYGGWWMRLPSALRKQITIDGEAVVELDFKALHPRMAYHLCGQPLGAEEDPYDLGGAWAGVDRAIIKVAFNQLLAVGPEDRIKKPRQAALPRGLSYPKLLAALEQKHAPIRTWLRSARALELQHLDSLIAEGVLGYFTHALRRPVLPVHDSFLVAAGDEGKLGETMFLAYRAVMNGRSGVEAWPVVKGWTPGGGAEERVLATVKSMGKPLG